MFQRNYEPPLVENLFEIIKLYFLKEFLFVLFVFTCHIISKYLNTNKLNFNGKKMKIFKK